MPFIDAIRIPSKLYEDTTDTLIEKHALLDVILESSIWGRKYQKNPFPYIGRSNEISPEDKQKYKSIFKEKYKFYTEFLEERLKLPENIINLIQDQS